MFSSFFSDDEVKPKFVIRDNGKSDKMPSLDIDANLVEQMSDIKDLVGKQFETIVEEIRTLHAKIEEIDTRMSKVEVVADTTIDELVSYYLTIFKNLDSDADDAKKKLIEELGKNTALNLIDQMEKVMHNISCDEEMREKISQIKELLS